MNSRSDRTNNRLAQRALETLAGAVFVCMTLTGSAQPEPVAGSTPGPSAIVLLDEQVSGVLGTTAARTIHTAENVLVQELRKAGYQVLDPDTVRSNLAQNEGLRLLEGDDRAAAAVGLQSQSTYSIVGQAIAKPSARGLLGTRLQSIQATLSVRAIRTEDARVIATASANATTAHIDEVTGAALALSEAAESVATRLLDELENSRSMAQSSIALQISGLRSYRHLDFVLRYLETEVPGITAVTLSNFTEGLASIWLEHNSKTVTIARSIANHRFAGFRLEPTVVTGNRMDLVAILDAGKGN